MRTQLAGTVEIDENRLQADLKVSAGFHYSEAYSDYLCGGPWKSCMLWASGGDAGDGLVANYDYSRAPGLTDCGKQVPYLRELIEQTFNTDHLNFVRLAVISNSVTIPHRDLLELGDIDEDARNAHRVHVPLVTNSDCYFSEDNVVYQMRAGEVWFFDASRVHAAASLSADLRTHMILDFTAAGGDNPLVTFEVTGPPGIPAARACDREPLSDRERATLLGLSQVIDMDNWREVFGIVIKKHCRKDGGENFVWGTMGEIAALGGNEAVKSEIQDMHKYFLLERS